MADLTYEEIVKAAEQLSPEEQLALVDHLQMRLSEPDYGVTAEQLISELKQLNAEGAFDNVESLYGKYANLEADLSYEALQAAIHEASTEWEKELDEFFGDD